MKSYWDLSDKAKAQLTEAEVREYLDVELMVKGVKKVIAPVLKPIQAVEVKTETWFEVDGTYFNDAETAQKYLALNPKKSTYDYTAGYDYHYACPIEQKIEQVQLYNQQELLNLAIILKQNKQSKEENEKATHDYDKAIKAQNIVLDDVWTDYWRCRERAEELKRIVSTKAEYLKMTGGDEVIALEFLKKVYSETDIKEAFEN
jgi:hypothetical protein